MRVRGAVRGFRTLTRVALVGIIGGGAAACSSDASRLTSPFANPFAEPAATGSLPDDEPKPVAPLRTGRIQSEALGAPGVARPAPMASAIPAPAAPAPARVASVGSSGWSAQGGTRITVAKSDSLQQMATRYGVPASAILQANGLTSASQITPGRELVIPSYSNVSGLNPAAASMTARPARAVEERREDAKALEAREKEAKAQAQEKAQEKALEAKRLAAKEKDAKDLAARKAAEAKLAEAKAAEAKAAEEKARKLAALKDGDKKHVRPGQTPKVAETKADKAREEAKTAAKAEAAQKLAEAKAARDAAKAAAKETAKETTKQAAAERSAKEKVAKAEPAKTETKAPAKVEVAKADAAKAEPAATGSVAAAQSDAENFRWPAKGRVIAGYGSSGNEGINIALPEGTPVKAAEDGTVAYAGSDVKGYGKLVLVRHSNGFVSAYAHNGELDVKPGDKVKRGQTIAKSGASGNVTSPQLHFEIRKSGAPVDPMSQLASN